MRLPLILASLFGASLASVPVSDHETVHIMPAGGGGRRKGQNKHPRRFSGVAAAKREALKRRNRAAA